MKYLLVFAALSALCAERPSIVGIANFVIKTDSLEDERKFYTGVLGYEEVFKHKRPGVAGDIAVFKVNNTQYVEISQTLANEADDKLIQFGFETKDARKLRTYLASKGVTVPPSVKKDLDGNYSFHVTDPEGHNVEFVEYTNGGLHRKNATKGLSPNRLSDHILHVGAHVHDPDKQNKFWVDILGFRFQWKGGMTDTKPEWMSYMVPDGSDWIEYMLWTDKPSPQQLGVWHHIALATMDIQGVYKSVIQRGHTPRRPPNVARDGRWLLHLFDKHNTRSEFMVRKPVEKPCCSENLDPYVK